MIGGGDSLNNFISKVGGELSFGNKFRRARQPNGSNNHTGYYFGPGDQGINRTEWGGISDKNEAGIQSSPAKGLKDDNHIFGINRSYPAGFTPVSYFKRYSGIDQELIIIPKGNFISRTLDKIETNSMTLNSGNGLIGSPISINGYSNVSGFSNQSLFDFKYGLDIYENWPNSKKPLRADSKNNVESFDGSYSDKSWDKTSSLDFSRSSVMNSEGTPYENEDPVFFGFEIIIDNETSPLLNGEVIKFLNDFGQSNEEIGSRIDIAKSFKIELEKYFKFSSSKIPNEYSNEVNIYGTKMRRRHYIKRIDGLNLLTEANTAERSKSFVKYRGDLLKVSFYEDSNLSTGSLINLYKLMYWSRIRGKGIIPENLLRFDCQVIVSEVRNIARVRKAANADSSETGGDYSMNPSLALDIIKENVSRYVYNVYECQFHFDRLTHPDSIDLTDGSAPDQQTTVEMSFKFSDMNFEKFVFSQDFGKYESLSNRKINPRKILSNDPGSIISSDEENLEFSKESESPIRIRPLITGLSGVDPGNNDMTSQLTMARENFKRKSIDEVVGKKNTATSRLFNSLKKAVLNETQRQLNDQFRLLNNSIDRVRDSFGIGRMSDPTNVYSVPAGGSRIFFDVRNSLRNFAGDSLSGIIFK